MGNVALVAIDRRTLKDVHPVDIKERLMAGHPWFIQGVAVAGPCHTDGGVLGLVSHQGAAMIYGSQKMVIEDGKFKRYVDIFKDMVHVDVDKSIILKLEQKFSPNHHILVFHVNLDYMSEVESAWKHLSGADMASPTYEVFEDPQFYGPAFHYVGSLTSNQTLVLKGASGQFIAGCCKLAMDVPHLSSQSETVLLDMDRGIIPNLPEDLNPNLWLSHLLNKLSRNH